MTADLKAWRWTGLEPATIILINSFGNVIVKSADGSYWHIRPDEPSCKVVARSAEQFAELQTQQDFQIDWQMARLVHAAEAKLGPLNEGQCYCLKLPSILGGRYEEANFGVISLRELLAFSGYLAEQIEHVNDGETVTLHLGDGGNAV